MIKKTASILLFVCVVGQFSAIAQEESSFPITDLVETNGFFDVKTTEFTFKKLDENRRIIAFNKEDFVHLQSFFSKQEGVINVSGHQLDKTLEVNSLLEKDGLQFFNHCNIVEELNRLGYTTIRLRSQIKSQYLIASIPTPIQKNEMTAELLEEEKPEDCNECGNVKVSKEALELLKGMDFGGEMFNFGADSTSLKVKSSTDMK